MIKTPIYDFVKRYAESDTVRLHMPGHKGVGDIEKYDITEIKGAGSLYEQDGIITESESYASEIFGAKTFYSAEGSSLAIRAMLHLALLLAKKESKNPLIYAGRNAHRVFISTAALLDFDVEWIGTSGSYACCHVTADEIAKTLDSAPVKPCAVYLTSPDYLGHISDISAISAVCRERGVLLLVDNAHGAYLKFLNPSEHPIDLGADMCTDSAHKTLPVLTGGAYLHLSESLDPEAISWAKDALALFGSTSPSYLILSSLDKANAYLAEEFSAELTTIVDKISAAKRIFSEIGISVVGDEPLKITFDARSVGYSGYELADILRRCKIEPEFADSDYVTLMPSPASQSSVDTLVSVISSLEIREPRASTAPILALPERVMRIREAALSPSELLPLDECVGRVLAVADVFCPPAVPILVPGERISREHLEVFRYYGKSSLRVVKR